MSWKNRVLHSIRDDTGATWCGKDPAVRLVATAPTCQECLRCIASFYGLTLADRFWRRVIKSAEPCGCWTWGGALSGAGYGVLGDNRGGERGVSLAHRTAWELVVGPIPEGMEVLHRCDTPACVRADPDPLASHLFLGTQADNVTDCIRKNRHGLVTHPDSHVRGIDHPAALLKGSDVREIRRLSAEGDWTCASLGERFGVAPRTIANVIARRTWRHV